MLGWEQEKGSWRGRKKVSEDESSTSQPSRIYYVASDPQDVVNMGALVKRDRNHPSVVIWSFCNEGGCEGTHEAGGPLFQEVTYKYDGTRPTLANMFT